MQLYAFFLDVNVIISLVYVLHRGYGLRGRLKPLLLCFAERVDIIFTGKIQNRTQYVNSKQSFHIALCKVHCAVSNYLHPSVVMFRI